jgi:predicted esterase
MSDVSAVPLSQEPVKKPAPDAVKLPGELSSLKFSYTPSPDGVDSNLLVLFHGLGKNGFESESFSPLDLFLTAHVLQNHLAQLGDTQFPFHRLGTSFKLPQTAVLALRAPGRVPLLEEEAYQWWDSFGPLGEPIPHPDPTSTIDVLVRLVDHLVESCSWPGDAIHLFGFAQGGQAAAELVLALRRPERRRRGGKGPTALGSLTTVEAPLLSFPTIDPESRSETPVLVWRRENNRSVSRAPYEKGFKHVREVVARRRVGGGGGDEGMPRGQEEWKGVMEFWADRLRRRHPWELENVGRGSGRDGGGVFRVVAGGPTPLTS